MKPAPFPEQTGVYSGDPVEWWKGKALAIPLPAHVFPGDARGRVCFCWRLNWWERLRVLVTGRIWHMTLTYNGPLQPQVMTTSKPYMRKPHAQA